MCAFYWEEYSLCCVFQQSTGFCAATSHFWFLSLNAVLIPNNRSEHTTVSLSFSLLSCSVGLDQWTTVFLIVANNKRANPSLCLFISCCLTTTRAGTGIKGQTGNRNMSKSHPGCSGTFHKFQTQLFKNSFMVKLPRCCCLDMDERSLLSVVLRDKDEKMLVKGCTSLSLSLSVSPIHFHAPHTHTHTQFINPSILTIWDFNLSVRRANSCILVQCPVWPIKLSL